MTNRFIKIEEHSDLIKDINSNSILNSDVDAFNQFKSKREKEKSNNKRLLDLENNLTEIRNLLETVLEKI